MKLNKGQRIPIAEDVNAIMVYTQWDAGALNDSFDIDTSVFLLDKEGKAAKETDFVFYNNVSAEDCVFLSEFPDKPEKKRVMIDFKHIKPEVEKIEIVMSIYDWTRRKQNFGQVKEIRLMVKQYEIENNKAGTELFEFSMNEMSVETAVILCELYRYKGIWKVNAVGAGYQSGLKALCEQYKLAVVE